MPLTDTYDNRQADLTERALWDRALQDPSPDQLRVLADWHEEKGDVDLACALRWAAKRGKWPQQVPEWDFDRGEWEWQAEGVLPARAANLPIGLAASLPWYSSSDRRATFRSPRKAFDGLAAALFKLRAILD